MPCMQMAETLEQREPERAQRATRLTQGRLAAAAGAFDRLLPGMMRARSTYCLSARAGWALRAPST